MFSFFKYPAPFEDGIHSNVEVHLSFADRLRVLFGAIIYVEVDTLVEHSPGKLRSTSWAKISWPPKKKLETQHSNDGGVG